MDELTALLKEQNNLLKKQSDLLKAGFSSSMALPLHILKLKLYEDEPMSDLVSYRAKALFNEQVSSALDFLSTTLKKARSRE